MEGSTESSVSTETPPGASLTADPTETAGTSVAPTTLTSAGSRYDFGRSVWLASHRSGALGQTTGEIARHATDVLATWNANWTVKAGEVRVGTPSGDREVDWALLHFTSWQERGLLLVDHAISLSILVHLLGDPTNNIGPCRTLSAMEYSVVELILDPLVDLTASQLLLGGGGRIVHVEGPGAALAAAAPDLTFLVLDIDTGAHQGSVEIGLPTVSLQTFAEFVDRRQAGARSKSGGGYHSPQSLRILGNVGLESIIRFDPFPVSANVVDRLKTGDVLRTGHPVHRPLTAVIGGKPMYRVEAGQRGERLVAEIVDIPSGGQKGLN